MKNKGKMKGKKEEKKANENRKKRKIYSDCKKKIDFFVRKKRKVQTE